MSAERDPARTRRRALVAGGLVAVATAVIAVVIIAPTRSDDPQVQVPEAPTSDVSPQVPMRAEAIVLRTDQAVGGRFQVRVTNLGEEDFEVLGVRLESAGFETQPFTTRTVLYSPGERTDIPTPYGDARCDPGDAVEPTRAAVRLRAGDDEQQLVVPLESIYGALPKLHQRECDNARVAAAADVGFSAFEHVNGAEGPALQTDLSVRRVEGDEPIVVSDVRGSVIYRLVPDGLPLELAAGEEQTALPVEIIAARCDGHALGETKQPYVFPIRIAVGDEADVSYDIPVPVAQQDELYAYLADTCDIVN